MKTIDLNGVWKGTGMPIEFEGQVPGCVHTDLKKENHVGNMLWRYNADDVQWIEKWTWGYER